MGSGHAAVPKAGIGAVLKQGWEDLKHGGAKAPHAVSTGVSGSWHVVGFEWGLWCACWCLQLADWLESNLFAEPLRGDGHGGPHIRQAHFPREYAPVSYVIRTIVPDLLSVWRPLL